MNSYFEVISQLERDMQSNGFYPPQITLDDKFHRFSRDSKKAKKNCWYIGRIFQISNGKWVAFCTYSDWKISEKYQFRSDTEFSEVEWIEVKQKKSEFEAIQTELEKRRHERAKRNARRIWQFSLPVSSHPYLTEKGLSCAIGARVYNSALVIPVKNIDGELVGLQMINDSKSKRFLSGQKNKGAFFVIGYENDLANIRSVNLVEGVATGYSVFNAEKKTVVCAFNKGNIENVCRELKEKYPLLKIKICADNDRFTEGNPGVSAAKKAAKKFNASYVFPTFEEDDSESTDFNDLQSKKGIDEVRSQLSKATFITDEIPPASQLAEDFLIAKNLVLSNRPILHFWQNEFYQYRDGRYIPVSQNDLFSQVINFLQTGGARQKATTRLTHDVISNLKGHAFMDGSKGLPCWLDNSNRDPKDYISMKNGLLNLVKWRHGITDFMEAHTPHFFNVAQIPYGYDQEAKCNVWMNFLKETLPDPMAQKTLQQWFGYNLINDQSFQRFLIMYGEGANGKSVVCTVLKALLGSENVSATTLESLDPKRTFPLAATMGKLANIVGELNATDKTAEGELKKFVSGEPMTVERKFGHPFTFIPTARLTFATNVLPRLGDTSDGIWRRVLLLPFTVQIKDPKKQNRNLVSTPWWESSGELPGIFNWALEGLKELFDSGEFAESEAALAAREKYRSDSNPTRTFLLDFFEEQAGAIISSRLVYHIYSEEMKANGQRALGNTRLPAEVIKAFPNVTLTENPTNISTKEVIAIGLYPDRDQPRSRHYLNLREKKD